MTGPTSGSQEHRTVSRVTGILEFVARSKNSVRLADMVNELDAPRSSIHGLVHGLASTGYLQVTEDGRYTLGNAVQALLVRPSAQDQHVRAAMEALNLEFDETVTLVLLAGESVIYTDAIESSHVVRYYPVLGVRRPLYPTSAGKCFLAHAPESYCEKYLNRHIPTAAKRSRVLKELEKVRAEGYAVNTGETLPDLQAVSAPIFDNERVSAVITVGGPISRMSDNLDEIIRETRDAAARASSGRG
ncbi:IclR family transcriptional regulator [Nocardia farcinica]|uniref:IclR family transcriptional regulator n=1 Tax=Nocardia farcinica TaxID=37329 RepID=UPI001895287A|nr:IclR family transcriptional regulator [Nocardia farcinica]MBF6271709.1 IclR family transcriptional regulator [Nocardia farcinica]MCZ9330311.1 IclR family transcriptional regulator [Nocardia farcinica]